MNKIIFAFVLSLLLIISLSYAQIENPKDVDYVKARIIQSGSLIPDGPIKSANLTIQIPQVRESIDVEIYGDNQATHKIIKDTFGNEILLLELSSFEDTVSYRIETIVKSNAHFSENGQVGYDEKYLQQTDSIILSPEITNAAYPFEKSLVKAAELTKFVNDYMTYDLSLVGERKSSVWAFENKRGVCVEYANLLTALLRATGIPTRYVNGYSYSVKENKFVGHTWIEVLIDNGDWVPFDPTWLEGGYLDATHIKTGAMLDNKQENVLIYSGAGKN